MSKLYNPVNRKCGGSYGMLLLLLTLIIAMPASGQGFYYTLPPNVVTINSGQRNNVFYVGQTVSFALSNTASVSYAVRDYYGNIVDSGAVSGQKLTVHVTAPGWYKLYLYGNGAVVAPYYNAVGGTNFVIFRNTANFPANAAQGVSGGLVSSDDDIARGVTAMGPQRHFVSDSNNPSADYAQLDYGIGLDTTYYTPYDSTRPRPLMIAFPNGTSNSAGVIQVVQRYQDRVKYWEGRNEPNYTETGAQFAAEEKAFYQAVKSVNPNLKVLGPAIVSVDPGTQGWLIDFLNAGGGKYIDGFSFHAYNMVLGDVILARRCMDNLNSILSNYGLQNLEKWQTEQGSFAACYGAYQPNLQGRWTMVQMMVYEQYGIPKEHNHLWYDCSDGFWDEPTWWENDDGSFNPAAPLMRVWSEELYGTNFAQAYNFGTTGNNLYVGSLFTGPNKSVAAFISSGSTDGQVTVTVSGGSSLHVVSAFGSAQDIPVVNGQVTLSVPMLPIYVELASGQTITPQPVNWGANLAMQSGVYSLISGTTASNSVNANISRLNDGLLQNHYWTVDSSSDPYWTNSVTFPVGVEMHLPSAQTIDHVLVYAAVPWSWQSTLQDYDLQYLSSTGQWVTLQTVTEPTNTFNVYTPQARCTLDSFYSDRWAFIHAFNPVTTSAIRLWVRAATYGGGATASVGLAGGQTGPEALAIREVEIYNSGKALAAQTFTISGQVTNSAGAGLSGVAVSLSSGSIATTNSSGQYSFTSLPAGVTYTVSPSLAGSTFSPSSTTLASLSANQTANFTAAAPSAPASLTATAQSASIGLTWAAVNGATSYTVYRATASGKEGSSPLAASITGASYTDTNVTAGTTYYYTVSATTPAGVSAQSTEASATLSPATYSITGQVNDANGNGLSGAFVALSNGSTATTTSAGSFSFTGITAGASYTVTPALTGTTFSPASATIASLTSNQTLTFAAIAPPSAPASLTAAGQTGSIALSWSAAAGATSYSLYRSTTSGGEGATAYQTGLTGTSYTDTNVAAGTTYYYTVVATNGSVSGSPSIEASATSWPQTYTISGVATDYNGNALSGVAVSLSNGSTTTTTSAGCFTFAGLTSGTCYTVVPAQLGLVFSPVSTTISSLTSNQSLTFCGLSVPAVPSLAASGSVGSIALSWPTAMCAQSYVLYRSTTPGGEGTVAYQAGLTGTSYTDSNVATGVTYYYTLAAVNTAGSSAQSTEVSAASQAPTYSISGKVTDSNGNALAGVSVALSNGSTATTSATGVYSFTGLAGGVSYTLTPSLSYLSFSPASATIPSLSSNQSQSFAAVAPSAPSGLAATGQVQKIALTWGSVMCAKSYVLYRGTKAGGEGATAYAAGITGASYTDTNVTAGATYYYTVAAVTTAGTSGQSTEASAVALPVTYAISGKVTNLAGSGVSGATVALSGSASSTTTTDVNGNYGFSSLTAGGTFTMTPSLSGYVFTPASTTVTGLSSNQTAAFTALVAGQGTGPASNSLSGIWMSGSSLTGGSAIAGCLTMRSGCTAASTVSLSSNAPSLVTFVPSLVSLGLWQNYATFAAQTSPVAADTVVTVVGSYNGQTVSTQFTVLAPRVSSISTGKGQTRNGASFNLTVNLTSPAPAGGLPVTLVSNQPNVIAMPATLTVPAGATTATIALVGVYTAQGAGTEVLLTAKTSSSTVNTILAVTP
ncbi:MAG: carboxypeptidase regulatory-like domain-containing protein [Capsulimonadaceae bacterium]|nr:carboxypeptidase regulatory-like domain-containing protein [Capsulimonadaceae bacterium]